MDLGFDTIGNATLLCYERGRPILATDPWTTGTPYFGSWSLSHEIPLEQQAAVRDALFVWISHGHPDHLSIDSLRPLKGKQLLLADHVGGRIHHELRRLGYRVTVLRDHVWTRLSNRIRVQTIADYNQDSILLVDLDGTLIVNLNDACECGWGPHVRRVVRGYQRSFLLRQAGSADVDMINLFDESGRRTPPMRIPVGFYITASLQRFGCQRFIPFSSMHRFQRSDSVWAEKYRTDLCDYDVGFNRSSGELLPAFVRYDCARDELDEIRPQALQPDVRDPSEFGDDWSEELSTNDVRKVRDYFGSISHLGRHFRFINVRVGGRDNAVDLGGTAHHNTGVTFEAPRHSLMKVITYEIFDDLLIGNFMKTTLHGRTAARGLYPDFSPYVAKYADNGRAKSAAELNEYFRRYRRRTGWDYARHRIEQRTARMVRPAFDPGHPMFKLLTRAWFPE